MENKDMWISALIGFLIGAFLGAFFVTIVLSAQNERDVAQMKLKCYTDKKESE